MVKLKLGEIGVPLTKARPEFDKQLKFGKEQEDQFYKDVTGDVEIKCDKICIRTGNVFVEFEDAGKPSGINTTKSKYYVFTLYKEDRKLQTHVMIPTSRLKKLMKKYPIKSGGDNWEARGHIIPAKDLLTFEYQ